LDDEVLHDLGRQALAGSAVQEALDEFVAQTMELGDSDRRALERPD
jgi:hypothetical protein